MAWRRRERTNGDDITRTTMPNGAMQSVFQANPRTFSII